MAKATSSTNGVFDAVKVFGAFRVPSFDFHAVAEAQRLNLEAVSQANRLAAEGFQAVAQRQVEIVQQALKDASALMRDWAKPGAPEEFMTKNAEIAKQTFENGLAHVRELNELMTKAGTDAFSVIARRVSESFDEVRLYAKKQAAVE
jgi:phasin family protein